MNCRKLYNSLMALGCLVADEDQKEKTALLLHRYRQAFLALYGGEMLLECVDKLKPEFDRLCAHHGCTLLECMNRIIADGEIGSGQAMMIIAVVAEMLDPSVERKEESFCEDNQR